MSANVETMFYVREKPWHGLGTEIKEAPASADALIVAGLDWTVEQRNVYSEDGSQIPGYKVNTRSTDQATLGIVSDRYKVVQNVDAFQFTDDLLGDGVTYETAGSLQGGRKVWMLARMPQRYIISGDEIAPYLVVMNSHDGSSGIKVAMTPIRVVCQNTLNLALNTAKRIWAAKHTENVMNRVYEARDISTSLRILLGAFRKRTPVKYFWITGGSFCLNQHLRYKQMVHLPTERMTIQMCSTSF